MRKIIFHYHLFKNAGTSIDFILKEAFGKNKWQDREFANVKHLNRKGIIDWIEENKKIIVYSSHTARFPLPQLDDVDVFPIIFVRHPIDRIYSAYKFEKNQGANNFGSVLARHTDFKGYVLTRLSLPHDRQCRNFHLSRFSDLSEIGDSELDRAINGLSELPFVGVVEDFNNSLIKLGHELNKQGYVFSELKYMKTNTTTSKVLPLEVKLNKIKELLGEETYNILLEANKQDVDLYNHILANY